MKKRIRLLFTSPSPYSDCDSIWTYGRADENASGPTQARRLKSIQFPPGEADGPKGFSVEVTYEEMPFIILRGRDGVIDVEIRIDGSMSVGNYSSLYPGERERTDSLFTWKFIEDVEEDDGDG